MPTITQSLNTLPRPKAHWLLGHSGQFSQDPLQFLIDCEQQHGDIVPLRLGLSPACLISRPEYIEEILKERLVFIKNTPGWRAIRTLVGTGLLTSEGDFWAKQRRLTQPIFHQQRISGYASLMVQATEQLLTTWQDEAERDVHQDMMQLTLGIVTQTIFNVDIAGPETQKIAHALDLSMEWFSLQQKQGFLIPPNVPLPATRRYRAAVVEMDRFIYQLIQQRRASPEASGDLLSMLLQVEDEDGSRMSDRQLRDELATLMLAGHETTANALAWTWMLLAQNPAAEKCLWQELDTVLAGRAPTMADLSCLTYTQQVIKESMRLYPPVVLIARSVTQDYALDGYTIPQNSVILMSPWVMHRNQDYFPEPDRFKPERWQGDLEKQLPKCVYLPFGEGPRICIGKSFAQMEAVLILATLAQHYQVRLVEGQTITPLPSITLRPKTGIHVQLIQRHRQVA
ncbi:cytochrome P450 [filamentous cyanobacterium LEGE 11480]|uniref:Cytochrome P450 n=1 Tax=Romeriopsis navalis LEGE 11480 TaxID=2777977 RepID=A0A928Z6B4_9CYAN|nr:cytochrome P450 [Romeriopsis navalis]MBE9032448.1 cytochrome P450 [Romeriopsis navalis LEGE 11480]